MAAPLIDPVEAVAGALREKRPLVLFAGQNHDPSTDSILLDFLKHLGSTDCNLGWRSTLDHGISSAQMEWLSERFDRSVPSDTITPIYDVAWSAIFTSSIDPRFSRRFESRGRQPESVLSKDTYARVPRSRSRPPVYYLLGKSDETVTDGRAPRKHSDLHRRLSHATELLNRITETATVRGLVVIAGYAPDEDWMQADWLLAPLSNGVGPTVLWFGFREPPNSIVTDEMIRDGSLITTTTSLSDAIGQLESRGVLDLTGAAGPDEPGMVSMAGGAVLHITPALRLRVEASAAIVDDEWTEEPELLGDIESDDAFRRFHSTPGNFRLLLDGVSRGFAIEREFERLLWGTFTGLLTRLGQPDSNAVAILHGQSGTGKSVALARLIKRIRLDLQLPVVVATDRIPNYADIEDFCLASERLSAPATVLVCDSNQAPQRYDELASALLSRGRRLLIVGTCYRLDSAIERLTDRFVEAPARVSQAERSEFELLQRSFIQGASAPSDGGSRSIFAMFYRRLPPSRRRLASGVSSEARSTEGVLRRRARAMPKPVAELPALAQQLIAAGVVSRESSAFTEEGSLAAIGQDWAGRLIEYVMVSGSLECPVPVDLLFRKLSQFDRLEIGQIVRLFSHLDLFRWKQNEEGSDYLIAPRNRLEAYLICKRRLMADQQIDRLVELIHSARPGIEKRAERVFLLNLLFMIDRGGAGAGGYQAGYLRFADALRHLRERYKMTDPDLILRECVLRRRAVQAPDRTEGQRLAILDEARDTIERTLVKIDDEEIRVSVRTRRSLVSERAAIYGYLAVQRAKSNTSGYWSDYLAATSASERAIGVDRSLYPIDIALWTATDVLESKRGELSSAQKAELWANLYAALDMGDEVVGGTGNRSSTPLADSKRLYVHNMSGDLDDPSTPNQTVRYLKRRSRVAHAVGDQRLDEDTLRDLERVAPAAVTYIVARRKADKLYTDALRNDREIREVAGNAAEYMSRRSDSGVELDDRCLRLLLQLRWSQATGERLLLRQRGATPVDQGAVQDLLEIVSDLNERAGYYARSRERFLEAVLSWLLQDTRRAIDIWRSLSDDTEYQDSSRVVRWLVMTDKNGRPREFRGRLDERTAGAYWVRVDGMNISIRLLANEFPKEDLGHGRELRGFGISFNYIGPVADSLSRSMRRR